MGLVVGACERADERPAEFGGGRGGLQRRGGGKDKNGERREAGGAREAMREERSVDRGGILAVAEIKGA